MPINFANALMPFIGGAAQGVTNQLNRRQEEKLREAAYNRYLEGNIRMANLADQRKESERVAAQGRKEGETLEVQEVRNMLDKGVPFESFTPKQQAIAYQIKQTTSMQALNAELIRAKIAAQNRSGRGGGGRGGGGQKPVKPLNLSPDERAEYSPILQGVGNMGLKDWEEIDAATAALNQVGPFLEGTNYQHIVDELNQKVSLSSAKLGPRPIKGMGPPTAGGGNFFSPGSRGEALVQGYGEVMDKGKERYMKYGGPLPWAIKGIQAGGNYLQGPASEGMNPLAGMNPLPAIGGALQQIPTQPGMDIWGNPLPAGNTNIWQSPFKRRK